MSRHVGLPAMLKAGEYSPNNPRLRGALGGGVLGSDGGQRDAFVGLGEYEERRRALRRLRQIEYKRYLDQQQKQKQESKILQQQQRVPSPAPISTASAVSNASTAAKSRVETGVQCERSPCPLSVAVQTDHTEFMDLPLHAPLKSVLTQAERELSPRAVAADERPIKPASWLSPDDRGRRRSYGDFDAPRRDITGTCVARTLGPFRPPTEADLETRMRHISRVRCWRDACSVKEILADGHRYIDHSLE